MIILLVYLISIFLINLTISRYQIILSNSGLKHQSFVNKSVPLTGGFFFLLASLYLFLPVYFFFSYIFIALFILGLLSDLNIFNSPKKRFLLQCILVLFFSFVSKLEAHQQKLFS